MGACDRIAFGKQGEDAAVEYLRRQGYRIIERNYRNRFGEIDIIARHGATVCFIEVKTRRHSGISGLASITGAKQRKLSLLAAYYLKEKGFLGQPARFDVVGIVLDQGSCRIRLIRNAFESFE